MKIILSGLVLSTTFILANDYVPLSDFSKVKKKEYKFTNTYVKPKNLEYKKTNEFTKKRLKQKSSKHYRSVKKSPVDKSYLILQNTKNTNAYYESRTKNRRDISVVTELTYHFFNGKVNDTKLDSSKSFIPKIYLNIDKHTIVAKYLKTNFDKIKNSNYTLGYRYNINQNNGLSANVGLDMNYFEFQNNKANKLSEFYPSFEFDLNHDIVDTFNISYGAGVGSNGSGVKHAYNYFADIETNPHLLNNHVSILAGYKGRTYKDKNSDKYKLHGPYLGLKAFF